MKEENNQTYLHMIETWSRIYKSKIGDLFTLEELKQEAWLAVLNAEEYAERVAIDKTAFLAKCIKNSLLTLLLNELKHRTIHIGNIEKVDATTPEEIQSSDEIYKKLKINIKKIPNAEFILPYLNIRTVREISEIAKNEGLIIGKSQVHNIISLIRKELDKIIRG